MGSTMTSIETALSELNAAIQKGDHVSSQVLTNQLLEAGVPALRVLHEGLMPGMEAVGMRFKRGELFLPEVLVSARAMKVSMAILEPLLSRSEYKSKGKVLLGTVKGDVHDIGKNLVGIMLRGAGYEVMDIGVGCDAERFVEQYHLHHPDIVGLSALLTTTMVYMKTVVEAFATQGLCVPIIVGGAPVTPRFAEEIGAAGYAPNAADAVALVENLLAGQGERT
jgi:5-methyltetrahydrofolate--homocysteine methyltransferase